MYVGTIPCPICSVVGAGSSGFQDQFLENPKTIVGDFEPCSSALFPETTQRTGDVFFDLKEDSGEKPGESPVQGDDSVPLVS